MAFLNQCRGLVCGALLAHNCWPRSNSTAMIGTPKKKAARYRAASDATVCRLGDHRFALLLLCAFGSPRLCRKLQYGCLLVWGQAGEQDNLPIRELKRIAVGRRFFVELPEDRRLVLRRYPHRKPLFDQRSNCPIRGCRPECGRNFRGGISSNLKVSDHAARSIG